MFLVLPQHEQLYPEGLSVFAPFSLEFYLNYKLSIEIQGLSSTDCNFYVKIQGLEGACEPCWSDTFIQGKGTLFLSPLNRGSTELKTFLAHQEKILTCNYPEKEDKTIFEPCFWYKLGLDLSHLCLKFFRSQGLEFIVFVSISLLEEWFRSEVQKAGQGKLQISVWNSRVRGLQEARHKAQ